MRRYLIIISTCLFVFAAGTGGWIWWGDWPDSGPPGEISEPALIVVLGGGDSSRTREALRLAEKFPAPPILVTGDGGYHQSALLAGGLDPDRMEVEPDATSTRENATLAGPWINETRGQVVLVTNDFHAPRSLAVFRSTYPDHEFVVASEAGTRPFNRWQTNFRRRERAAAIFYLFRYRINSFAKT